jgi:hypothetical protein
MFPEDTSFDEATRHLFQSAQERLLFWLLDMPGRFGWGGWRGSVLTLPGGKERVCDGVARLADLARNGVPVAALFESQTEPDPDMFGRMLLAGAICWLTTRPTDLPGDRWEMVGVVLNLTGAGDSSRSTKIGTLEWTVTLCERNLASMDASKVLEDVRQGRAPLEALALIPAMQKGGEEGTIAVWKELAAQEQDADKRSLLSLAVVYANLTNCQQAWKQAL